MSISRKERIFEFYDAFSAGKLDLLAEMFDEHVDFVSNAPVEIFPYLGHRVGRGEVMKALQTVHNEFEGLTFMPVSIVVENNTVGVIVSIRARQRSTRRMLHLFAAHFLRFKEERIVEYRSILDSFEAVQQAIGRELDLPSLPVV